MALTAIRLMIGPVPALVLVAGMALTYFYPITQQRHAEVRAQLEARQARAKAPPET
jgi:GPH family glycoside/pentoside/hexuronide:cation symporter